MPIAGATERGPSGMDFELGVAVASAATELGRCHRLHRRDLRIVFLGLLRFVLRHHPVGFFRLGRLVLRQLGFLDLGLLLVELGRRGGRIGVRTGWQVGHFPSYRRHFQPDLDRLGAERIVVLVGLQLHDRQRRSADVKRERNHRGGNPDPPGWLEIVEAGHGFAGAACGAGASGTPSSATSLIFA